MIHKRRAKTTNKRNIKEFPKRTLILALVLFVLAFFIYKGIVIYSDLTESSIKTVISTESSNNLLVNQEGLEKRLIILEGEDYKIEGAWQIITNENTSESIVFYIPSWVYFEDHSDSYVDYISVRDFLYTGLSINTELGHEYAIWQLQNITGISSDSYIWLNSEFLGVYTSMFGDINTETVNYETINSILDRYSMLALLDHSGEVFELKESVMSNLNDLNVLKSLGKLSNQLDYEGVEVVDLSEQWVLTEVTNRNGEAVSLVNIGALDERIHDAEDIIRSSDIEKELVEIEVYNGSGISGVAGRYARRFQNSGVDVIRYDNSPVDYEISTIYVSDPERFSNSLELIRELMIGEVKVVYDRPDFMTTGDIVVILGQDVEVAGIIVK